MEYSTTKAKRLPTVVSNICFGTAPLGSMPDTYGYQVDDNRAWSTIEAVLELEHSFIDTSRNYGLGRSETRVGRVFRTLGGQPENCVLSTKIDRDFNTDRLDANRVRKSAEESLEALGVEKFDILHLHDPEHCADLDEIMKTGGALDELFRLKEEGLVGAVGIAMGNIPLLSKLLDAWGFDALINHNRFTLLNREADALFTKAYESGVAVFNAAPFAGGVLAKGPSSDARITYQRATEAQLRPVRALSDICDRHNVPLPAAALQFSMRDPRITSTIVGVSKRERVTETIKLANWNIPEEAWNEILSMPYASEDPEAMRDYSIC